MSKVSEVVINKLKECKLEPVRIQENVDLHGGKKDLIFYKLFVIIVNNEKKQISVCFDVRALSSFSANVTLKLTEIRKSTLKNIIIDLPFYVSPTGNIFFGVEAISAFEKEFVSAMLSEKLTEDFLKTVSNSKIPSC